MADEKRSPLQIRSEIYEELLVWLRRQNASRPSSFLDRPFVLTIMGGLTAALLTTWWQASDKRREMEVTYQRAVVSEQLSLVKEFDAAYENTGEIVNSWFARVIWIAEEANKPNTPVADKKIAEWKEQTHKLEERFSSAVPVESVALRISVLYRCASVKDAAAQTLKAWRAYVSTFQTFNRDWNERQQLSKSQIDATESSRKKMLAELERHHENLIAHMAGEVSAARDNTSTCPP
jgi:type II secretory pathway pseudopilin PulG